MQAGGQSSPNTSSMRRCSSSGTSSPSLLLQVNVNFSRCFLVHSMAFVANELGYTFSKPISSRFLR
uniref:Uncharacterized protein n=1 Tax=Arundo donax TaxID=35708 RepID=A0A0A8YLG1_ARUDO